MSAECRFLFVITGRNAGPLAERCLQSVASLDDDIRVAVVDDASTDGTRELVADYTAQWGWTAILRDNRRYALENQVAAWRALQPTDDDVIVFVDLDDALAHPFVTQKLREYYQDGAWMTYGSYKPWPSNAPEAATCRPAIPYPDHIVKFGAYRRVTQLFNHLRTVSWRVLKHVTDSDLSVSGHYFRANTDRAVMFPCLELSGPRAIFVPDVLYEYTCNSPDAVWRTMNPLLRGEDRIVRERRPKRRLPNE